MCRALEPAPMHEGVCKSRKSNARNVDDHEETKSMFWMAARAQRPTDDARRRRCVNGKILPLFALGAERRNAFPVLLQGNVPGSARKLGGELRIDGRELIDQRLIPGRERLAEGGSCKAASALRSR